MSPHISMGTKSWQLRTIPFLVEGKPLRRKNVSHLKFITSPKQAFKIRTSFYVHKTRHVWEGKAQLLRASLTTTPTAPPPRETWIKYLHMQKFKHIYKSIHTYLQSDPTRHRLLYPQSPIYHQLSTVYFLLSTIYSLTIYRHIDAQIDAHTFFDGDIS